MIDAAYGSVVLKADFFLKKGLNLLRSYSDQTDQVSLISMIGKSLVSLGSCQVCICWFYLLSNVQPGCVDRTLTLYGH